MPTTSLIDNDKPNEPDTDDDDADGGKDETRSAWPVAYEWGVSQEAQLEEAIAEAERQGGADPAHVLLADRLLPSPVRQAIEDWMKRAKEIAVRANKRPLPPDDGAIPTQARARGCTTADGARLPANLPVIGVAELEALVDKKEAAKNAWLRRVMRAQGSNPNQEGFTQDQMLAEDEEEEENEEEDEEEEADDADDADSSRQPRRRR